VIFGVLILFCCLWTYFANCGFSRTIKTCVCFFSVDENYLLFIFTSRNLLVKSPLYGDVSEKPMIKMIYPFFAGTLTFVRTIETFVEIFCHHFFSSGDGD
jgi:hypothetical protein